jgi:type 1 glutamine amidotransferase
VKIIAPLFLLAAVSLQAAVNFIPSFSDKPVSEEFMAKIEAALPTGPIVEPKSQRRILVVSATSGFRHKSIPTGNFTLEKMGLSSGAYEAVISDDPANFEPEALAGFDTVVLLNTTQDFFMPNNRKKSDYSEEDWAWLQGRQDRLMDNLVHYVEQGGGLMGIHAATDSCYNHEAYGKTIGGYFWGHPWGANSKVTIVVEDPEHATNKPVFGDTKDFELIEEIYQFKPEPYSRERLRILLHLDPERSAEVKGKKREDNDYAVAWVQQVGKGRVFYTSLGHNHHIYWNPMLLKHYLAGIQFTCGDLKADTTPSAKIEMPNMGCCPGH